MSKPWFLEDRSVHRQFIIGAFEHLRRDHSCAGEALGSVPRILAANVDACPGGCGVSAQGLELRIWGLPLGVQGLGLRGSGSFGLEDRRVSENRGPESSTLNSRILIIRTPE